MRERRNEEFQEYLEVDDRKNRTVFNPNTPPQYKKELPTDPLLRRRVIEARKEAEQQPYGSIFKSIFNKKALVRQDQ